MSTLFTIYPLKEYQICVQINRNYVPLNFDVQMRIARFSLPREIVFFRLCEGLLLPASGGLASLYTLMFCNVITYCVAYVKVVATPRPRPAA